MEPYPNRFSRLVDDMVLNDAPKDPELFERLQYLDLEARRKGKLFYDIVYDVLYRSDISTKAKDWLSKKNG